MKLSVIWGYILQLGLMYLSQTHFYIAAAILFTMWAILWILTKYEQYRS